jgi:hypothetical protein
MPSEHRCRRLNNTRHWVVTDVSYAAGRMGMGTLTNWDLQVEWPEECLLLFERARKTSLGPEGFGQA